MTKGKLFTQTGVCLCLLVLSSQFGMCLADCARLIPESICLREANESYPVGTILDSVKGGNLVLHPIKPKFAGYIVAQEIKTGEWKIFVNETLDLEGPIDGDNLQYELTCKVIGHLNYRACRYTVAVTDVNEYAPRFPKLAYSVAVKESLDLNHEVFSFEPDENRPVDPDATRSPNIHYTILDGDDGYFEITQRDRFKGIIKLKKRLDYEAGPRDFYLNISAKEPQDGGLESTTTLNITVTDVDDVGPVFSNPSYTLTVKEGVYDDTTEFDLTPPLSARDGDKTINQSVELKIDEGTNSLYPDLFNVSQNGSLIINGRLNTGQYAVNVKAYQTDKPLLRQAVAVVVVTVTDANDHYPNMSHPEYTAKVSEAAPVGTTVMTVKATDEDVGDNAALNFVLGPGTNGKFIVVTSGQQGFIILNHAVDRETEGEFHFQVWAEESKSKESHKSDPSNVTITVLDENDNSPMFGNVSYGFSINETSTAGETIGRVQATDLDEKENGVVTYKVTSTVGFQNIANIDTKTGELTLARGLNNSDVGIHQVTVIASDNALEDSKRRSTPVQVTVRILQVNDHPPEFTFPDVLNVSEITSPNTVIGQIKVNDPDGDQVILTGSSNKYLHLNSNGDIVLKEEADLDSISPPPQNMTFDVNATDGIHTVTRSIVVNFEYANEFSPVFETHSTIQIFENATGQVIGKVQATDNDMGQDGQVTYSLLNSPAGSHFSIDADTGEITLNCSSCLERSLQRSFDLTVKAIDGGQPPRSAVTFVTVEILSAPKFTHKLFKVNVQEEQPPQLVMQLPVTDVDTPAQQLKFNGSPRFPASVKVYGNGSVFTTGPLDAENQYNILVDVSVTDGNSTDYATVNISVTDINDNPPKIGLPSNVKVPENATPGQSVANVTAADNDITNTGFTYVLGGGGDGKFKIDASTGEITVNGPFDMRQKIQYNLSVIVFDYGVPPQQASDNLLVEVADSNVAPKFIDYQGNPVTNYTFDVYENATLGQFIGSVFAYDPDSGSSGQLNFQFVSRDPNHVFSLDSDTTGRGNLTLAKYLNFEQKPGYTFTIKVSDFSFIPKSAEAKVTITVMNVVEAPSWPLPLPTVYLSQSSLCKPQLRALSQELTSVSSQGDEAVEYSLLNMTDKFSINRTTGLMQVNKTLPPDTYVLGLSACSSGTSVCSFAALTVVVQNNDILIFCPVFYSIDVSETEPTGSMILDLNTNKKDATLQYTITHGNDKGKFWIDPTNGKLYLNVTLDREETPAYTLTISAVDTQSNETADAQVIISLIDAPDSPPKFEFTSYQGEIAEDTVPGQPVFKPSSKSPLMVKAVDEDENPELTYSINMTDDTSNGSFTINNATGVITLAKAVDYDSMTQASYTFNVLATDGYYWTSSNVTVSILDVNDNTPRFVGPSVLKLNVTEGVHTPRDLVTLNATDQDSLDAGKLKFSLDIVSPAGVTSPFNINSKTGLLRLVKELDREVEDQYEVNATVTDSAGHKDVKLISVTVLDLNDNIPKFSSDIYNMTVTEDHGARITVNTPYIITGQSKFLLVNCSFIPAPSQISHVTSLVLSRLLVGQGSSFEGDAGIGSSINIAAADNDTGQNGDDLEYSIISGNDKQCFEISTSSGQPTLKVVQSLDREAILETNSSVITLTLKVSDQGTLPKTSTCLVLVTVLDVNDNSPKFDLGSGQNYLASVAENVGNNTEIVLSPDLKVTDADIHEHGRAGVKFSLNGSSNSPFAIDRDNGQIFVHLASANDHLDRETKDVYFLQIVATDSNGSGLNGTAGLIINITDVNDEPPYFPELVYNFNISETSKRGYIVGTLTAKDNDTVKNSIWYELENSSMFAIDPRGKIQVIGSLDREDVSVYNLTVSACEAVNGCSNTTVIIEVTDSNDRCPIWNQTTLSLHVSEGQQIGEVGRIGARDDDLASAGAVVYSMNDTDASQYFEVHQDGTVKLRIPLEADKPNHSNFSFLVYAADEGQPPCVTPATLKIVVIGSNDHDPQICLRGECETIKLTAYEGSEAGTVIDQVQVQDQDTGADGEVAVSVLDVADIFAITDFGILSWKQKLTLDQLKKGGKNQGSMITFTLLATDKGNPPRSANVTVDMDIVSRNPNRPVFLQPNYTMNVRENEAAGTVIGSVETASFGNSKRDPVYSIYSSTQLPFDVSGNGSLSTTKILDRETQDSYSFIVKANASDASSSSLSAFALVTVIVTDVNEAPKFDDKEMSVKVNEGQTKDLLNVRAHDYDTGVNSKLTYKLKGMTSGSPFTINSTTGILSLIKPLDYENQTHHKLVVEAVDGGSTALSASVTVNVVVLDINDHSPQFLKPKYETILTKSEEGGLKVLTVNATDADSGDNKIIRYSLIRGPDSKFFFISPITGVIETVQGLKADFYNLTVIATDGGSPPKSNSVLVNVTVVVNKTDIIPSLNLSRPVVHLFVGMKEGTLNVNFMTKDAEKVHISGGSARDWFRLDFDQGKIFLSHNLAKEGEYFLRITATSSTGYNVTEELQVRVSNLKFDEQDYIVNVLENANVPVVILRVNSDAERERIPLIYALSPPHPDFKINNSTGDLTMITKPNREQSAVIALNITMQLRQGTPSQTTRRKRAVSPGVAFASIYVRIKDVNDNVPSFGSLGPELVLSVPVTAEASFNITTLKAFDLDEGINGMIRYSISKGNTSAFSLDPISGQLRVASSDILRKQRQFAVTVLATDQNGRGHSTPLDIIINVVQDNNQASLAAPIPLSTLQKNQDVIIRNLSKILGYRLELDDVMVHPDYPDRSDISFHAYNLTTNASIPTSEIEQKKQEKQAEISALFDSFKSLRQESDTDDSLNAASIALLVVAGIMFLACLVAIFIVYRLWKKQRDYAKKEENAAKVRQKMEQQMADNEKDHSQTSDPDEHLEMDIDLEDSQIFSPEMFHRQANESELPLTQPKRHQNPVVMEEQERTIYFDTDVNSLGQNTLILRQQRLDDDMRHMQRLFLNSSEGAGKSSVDSGISFPPALNDDGNGQESPSSQQRVDGEAGHTVTTSEEGQQADDTGKDGNKTAEEAPSMSIQSDQNLIVPGGQNPTSTSPGLPATPLQPSTPSVLPNSDVSSIPNGHVRSATIPGSPDSMTTKTDNHISENQSKLTDKSDLLSNTAADDLLTNNSEITSFVNPLFDSQYEAQIISQVDCVTSF